MPVKDRRMCGTLLDSVFSESPTYRLSDYLTSALMDLRRAMRANSSLVEEEGFSSPQQLPRWLRTNVHLPPWEVSLLSDLFTTRPIVVVRGGSGCGKTSVLYFTLKYCEYFCRRHRDLKILFVLDLQDQPDHLKHKHKDPILQETQKVAFLDAFWLTLASLLERVIPEQELASIFSASVLNPDEEDWTRQTRARYVQSRWCKRYQKKYKNKPPTWDSALSSLSEEVEPHDKIIGLYLLLLELAVRSHEKSGGGLVLAIDNVDPFPEYLQTELIRTFEGVSFGSASRRYKDNNLAVALFARLSTSTRHSGALDGVHAHVVNFAAPDPADVVFFRLAAFLLRPQNYRHWNELTKGDQEEIERRSWMLFERLVNQKGKFNRVFSGLAGTNSRTGCKLARWWILSRRFPEGSIDTESRKARLPLIMAVALLHRLSFSVARSLSVADHDQEDYKAGAIQIIVRMFFRQLIGIMVGNMLVRKKKGALLLEDDMREIISECGRTQLPKLLIEREHRRLREAALAPVKLASFDLYGKLDPAGRRQRHLLSKALEKEEHKLSSVLDALRDEDRDLARTMCKVLCSAITTGATAGNRHDVERDYSETFHDLVLGNMGANSNLQLSRWESVSILISPDDLKRRTERSALNIFSADGVNVAPVAAHVLCYLQEAGGSLQGIVVKERLERWGFENADIFHALKEMVVVDRRLIYSGVKDFRDGVENWFDTYHEVHISSAGSGYLNSVARSPAYLQWALLEPQSIRTYLTDERISRGVTTALGRLSLVLEGFRIVREDELRRARQLTRRSEIDVHPSLSPVSWLFFGGLERFIIDISGLQKQGRDRSRDMAREFLEFGRSLLQEHHDLFSMVPENWKVSLGFAENSYTYRFEARR